MATIKTGKVYTHNHELVSVEPISKRDLNKYSEFKLVKGTTYDGRPTMKIIATLKNSRDYVYLKAAPQLQDEFFADKLINPASIKIFTYRYIPTGQTYQVLDGDLM